MLIDCFANRPSEIKTILAMLMADFEFLERDEGGTPLVSLRKSRGRDPVSRTKPTC